MHVVLQLVHYNLLSSSRIEIEDVSWIKVPSGEALTSFTINSSKSSVIVSLMILTVMAIV